MPFEIVRNDIVNMQVDAVVNTANPNPVIGSGVDSGIHKKAGHELLAVRQKIGCIDFGDAVITPGFGLDGKIALICLFVHQCQQTPTRNILSAAVRRFWMLWAEQSTIPKLVWK